MLPKKYPPDGLQKYGDIIPNAVGILKKPTGALPAPQSPPWPSRRGVHGRRKPTWSPGSAPPPTRVVRMKLAGIAPGDLVQPLGDLAEVQGVMGRPGGQEVAGAYSSPRMLVGL